MYFIADTAGWGGGGGVYVALYSAALLRRNVLHCRYGRWGGVYVAQYSAALSSFLPITSAISSLEASDIWFISNGFVTPFDATYFIADPAEAQCM